MRDHARPRVRRSRRAQQEIIERFEASGLAQGEFCRREGIALSSLQRWRKRSRQAVRSDFVELRPAVMTATAPEAAARWTVEVMLPNGACIRFRE